MDNQIFSKGAKMFLVLSLFAVAFIVNAEVAPTLTNVSAELNAVKIDSGQSIVPKNVSEIEQKRAELKRELEKKQFETQQNILEKKREFEKVRAEARSGASDIKAGLREDLDEGRDQLRTSVAELKDRAVQIRTLNKEDIKIFEQKREELKDEIERKREEYKKEIENRREEAKQVFEIKREELKNRLLNIKDERKKKAVENIDEHIKNLNERMTDHFSNVLDKMEEVLKGISSRTDKAEAHGLDVANIRALVVNAETAIASARGSIAEQAGKVYDIDITTEDKLKSDVTEARKALRGDLEILKEVVKKAHNAIREAAVSLAQIPKVDEYEVEEGDSQNDNSATSSDSSQNN